MSRKLRLLLYAAAGGLTLLVLGIVTVLGAYVYFAPGLPDAQALKDVQLQVPLRIYTRDGRLIAEYGEQRRVPLTLEEVPDPLEHAILAAEDDRFYQHPGIDVFGIARAAVNNVLAGEIVGGASTITQQVARNFFLSFDQTWTRKIREAFLSIKIEQELTKDEILELYLNKIYLGNRAYGFGAASEIYYGKPLNQLNLAQMAMLATIPKAPSKYNPIADPERALIRRAYVLGRMLELGYIDSAAYDEAMAAPVTASYHGVVSEVDAYYVGELVRADLVARVGEEAAYTDGYRVITTLDSRLQKAANQSIRDALQEYDLRYGYRGPIGHLEPESFDAETLAEDFDAVVGDFREPGNLQTAVVMELTDTVARVFVREVGPIEIGMAGLEWAAPAQDLRQTGPAPEMPADVLAVGDIIYVLRDPEVAAKIESEADDETGVNADINNEAGWRLAQIPEVQGALVSLDPEDGAVVALVGGYDFFYSKYNRAVQARRQPGSSFKPFIYSAALANGFTPATIVNDAPVVFADEELEDVWRPQNDSGRFYGPTRFREALVNSRNLVSIRVLQTMGIGNAIDYLSSTYGFDRERLPRNLSLALGSGAYSPMEMASAYTVIANGGYRVQPYYIDEIIGPGGKTIFRADPAIVCPECEVVETELAAADVAVDGEAITESSPLPESPGEEPVAVALPLNDAAFAGMIERREPRIAERVQSAPVNYLIADMMRDVIQRGTGRRARVLGREDISGKTGTTNEYRDAWFSGFNPEIVTTVWIGFDDFSTLGSGEYGGRAALPAWINYMRVALAGTPEVYHERPPGLVTVRIDPETGLLAGAGNPDAIFETFVEGTVPPEQPAIVRENGEDGEDDTEQSLF
ncbi:MAG TPA: penicillin-binding protein 1A [Gammaproteobacteria bacterium]